MALLSLSRREHRLAGECWCQPRTEPCPDGEIVIHADEHPGLAPRPLVERDPNDRHPQQRRD